MKLRYLLLYIFLLTEVTVFATRNTSLSCTLSNFVVCSSNTNFSIYGPNNGAARWQTAVDTNGTIIETFVNTYNFTTTQSDTVVYYRRLSYDYADTSNWIQIRYMDKPILTSVSSYNLCSGDTTSITLTASINSTYSYSIGSNIGSITGATAGSGSTIKQKLINPSNATNGIIQYYVTPTSVIGGCVGSVTPVSVTVLPTPKMSSISTVSVCNDVPLDYPLAATVPSTFVWKVKSVTGKITGATDSIGSILKQLLHNPSYKLNGQVIYGIQPTSITGSCIGAETNYSVTVNPTPIIESFIGDTICSGGINEQIFFQPSEYCNIVWTLDNQQGVTGATAGSGTIMRQSLTNTSTNTYGWSAYLINLISNNTTCSNTSLPLKIYVAPMPGIKGNDDKLICNSSNTNLIPSTDYPGLFTWRISSNPGNIIGASASPQVQSGIFQLLNNPNTTTGSIVYLVKHFIADAPCSSAEKAITISVSPTGTPQILIDTFFTLCSEELFTDSLPANQNFWYSWKPIANTHISGANIDSGLIFTQHLSLLNDSHSVQVFTITPFSFADRCAADPFSLYLNINPLPKANFSFDRVVDTFMFNATNAPQTIYHWSFGDGDTASGYSVQHKYTQSGNYQVTLRTLNNLGCENDSTIIINYTPVGMRELFASKQLHIYPNPASTQLHLVGMPFHEETTFQIVEITGRIVLEDIYKTGKPINVESLNSGLYFIQIVGNNQPYCKPFLIQR